MSNHCTTVAQAPQVLEHVATVHIWLQEIFNGILRNVTLCQRTQCVFNFFFLQSFPWFDKKLSFTQTFIPWIKNTSSAKTELFGSQKESKYFWTQLYILYTETKYNHKQCVYLLAYNSRLWLHKWWAGFDAALKRLQPAPHMPAAAKITACFLISSGCTNHWSLFNCVLNFLVLLDLAGCGLKVLRFLPLRQKGKCQADRGSTLVSIWPRQLTYRGCSGPVVDGSAVTPRYKNIK